MHGEFRFDLYQDGPETVVVALKGILNERSDLSAILSAAQNIVIVDLAAIDNINSVGVREWLRFIGQLCAGHRVILRNCAPVMVRQFNMIFNARGDSEVESVILPYFCAHCANEPRVPLELKDKKKEFPLTLECSRCHGIAEFDDIPDTYLSFLDQTKPTNR